MDYDGFKLAMDSKKRLTKRAVEYWDARDIQRILGYARWEDFDKAIMRAKEACKSAGTEPDRWFRDAPKPIASGKGRIQLRGDYFLTRFAC